MVLGIVLALVTIVASIRPELEFIEEAASLAELEVPAASSPKGLSARAVVCEVNANVNHGKPGPCFDGKREDSPGTVLVDYAGQNAKSVCYKKLVTATVAASWGFSGTVLAETTIDGQTKHCFLCPVGKKYGPDGICATPTPLKGHEGTVFAGSSPEAACKVWLGRGGVQDKIEICPKTAKSKYRQRVTLPESIFPGKQQDAGCCLCPTNSFFKDKECRCRTNDAAAEEMPPVNGECPQLSLDEYYKELKKVPAIEQIKKVRIECLKHRFADELLDPQKYENYALRQVLLDGWPEKQDPTALAVEKLKVLELDAKVDLKREGGEVKMVFMEPASLKIQLENIVLMKNLIGTNHISKVNLAASISGSDMLAHIEELSSQGNLEVKIEAKHGSKEKSDTTGSSKEKSDTTGSSIIAEKGLGPTVMKQVVGLIFNAVAKMSRKAVIDSHLKPVTQGRDMYPMHLELKTNGDCKEDGLCLGVTFTAGAAQTTQLEKFYDAELEALNVRLEADASTDRFTASIDGTAKIDTPAILQKYSQRIKECALDTADGTCASEKPGQAVEAAAEAEVNGGGIASNLKKEREERKAKMRHVIWAAGKGAQAWTAMIDFVREKKATKAEHLLQGYAKEKRQYETALFEAWRSAEKNKNQQVIRLARTEKPGQEPAFAVTSIKNAKFKASGSLTVNASVTGCPQCLMVAGSLRILEGTQLIKLKHSECAYPVAIVNKLTTSMSEEQRVATLGTCWGELALLGDGLDVGVAENELEITGFVDENGFVEVVAAVKNEISLTASSGMVTKAANLVIGQGVDALVEEEVEKKLSAFLYREVWAKQRAALQLMKGSMEITVDVSDTEVKVKMDASHDFKALGKLQARAASKGLPESPASDGPGSAWQFLEKESLRKFGEQAPEDLAKLEGAREMFSYDPLKWINIGKNNIISEIVDSLEMKGVIDFKKSPSVSMTGTMTLNLKKLVLGKADRGMKDFGQYRTASGHVKHGGKDVDAVLSCGYLFLTAGGNSITKKAETLDSWSLINFNHMFDFTAAENEEGSVTVVGQCDGGQKLHGQYRKLMQQQQMDLCVDTGSLLGTAIRFELIKRDEVLQMVENKYKSSVQWWGQPAELQFKLKPFLWADSQSASSWAAKALKDRTERMARVANPLGAVAGFGALKVDLSKFVNLPQIHLDNVTKSCTTEMANCERTFSCLGVERFGVGDCRYLSSYDIQSAQDAIVKHYKVGPPADWGKDTAS